jgi:hypothetical protein
VIKDSPFTSEWKQVQELAGFGHLLSGFIGKDLCATDLSHLSAVMYVSSIVGRRMLLTSSRMCMFEFLECLIPSVPAAKNAADRLKEYANKIEQKLQGNSASLSSISGRSGINADEELGLNMAIEHHLDVTDVSFGEIFTQGTHQYHEYVLEKHEVCDSNRF